MVEIALLYVYSECHVSRKHFIPFAYPIIFCDGIFKPTVECLTPLYFISERVLLPAIVARSLKPVSRRTRMICALDRN